MFPAQSMAVIITLASVVALGPLSTDMYLPALPELTRVFNTDIEQVQITLSVFFYGFAVAQLFYGPLADRFGRKPVLLSGMLLFFLATLGCALATSVEELILYRFLQALGACAGPVLGRTMVRDIHGPVNAAKVLSVMGSIMALAPILAPVLGGYITVWFDWSATFYFLAAYALISALFIQFRVAESLDPDNKSSLKPIAILRNFGTLLKNRNYIGYTLSCSTVFAGLIAFMSGSSFVLIDYFGVKTEHAGMFYALASGGYLMGTQIAHRVGPRIGINRMISFGGLLATSSGLVMVIPALMDFHHLWLTTISQIAFMAAVGIVMPQAMAGALANFPQIAGTASSLLGFTQSIFAATAGLLVGHNHSGTPTTMALTIATMGLLSLLAFRVLVRPATEQA